MVGEVVTPGYKGWRSNHTRIWGLEV